MKLIPIATLAVLFAGCQRQPASVAATDKTPSLAVTVGRAEARQEPVTMAATGSFVADFSSALASEVEGLVRQTPVHIGDFVAQGAPVVVLDQKNATLRMKQAEAAEQEAVAALRQAESRLGQDGTRNLEEVPEVQSAKAALAVTEAELRLAHTEEQRAGNLLKTGDVSRSSYDRADSAHATAQARVNSVRQQYEAARNGARGSAGAVAGAQAALASAQAQSALARQALDNTVVRAPFAGFLSERAVSPGEYVTTTTRVGRLERIQPVRLQLPVPEADTAKIRAGQRVRASVQAFPGESFEGKVDAVNTAVNAASRTLLIEAVFPNHDRRLKPGMFATAVIEQGGTQDLVAVPAAAVEEDNSTDTFRAWVVSGGKAQLRIVQPVRRQGGIVLVSQGVKAGEAVITSGNKARLVDGAPVQVR